MTAVVSRTPTRAKTTPPESGAWPLATFLILAFVAPLVLVNWSDPVGSPLNILIAWAIVAFSSFRLAALTLPSRASVLEIAIFIFMYVFVGITPLAQTVTGTFPLDGRTYSDAAQTRQLIVLITGILALCLGMRIVGNSALRSRAERQFNQTGTAFLALLGLAFSAQQISTNGIATFFISRSETARILAGQSGTEPLYEAANKASIAIQTGFSQFPVFIALFIVLYSRRNRLWVSSPIADLWWRCAIPLLILANVVINNPIGNSRLWGLLVIFAFTSIYVDFQIRRNARYFLVASVSVLLVAFPVLDAFRFTDDNRVLSIDPQAAIVENGSYPVYQMALNGDQYVRASGFTQGDQMIGAIFAFVPRSVWPDKAIATGQLIDPRYLRSSSVWTEAYVDFGIPGVVVIFTLLGVFIRRLSIRGRTASPGVVHALVPLVAIYSFFVLRGSLLPAAATLYQIAAFFALAIAFGRTRDRADGAAIETTSTPRATRPSRSSGGPMC